MTTAAHPGSALASSHVRTVAHDGEPAPITLAAALVDDQLDGLEHALDVLGGRLDAVLAVPTPSPVDPGDPSHADVDLCSATTRRLDGNAQRLARLRAGVEDLIRRLEL